MGIGLAPGDFTPYIARNRRVGGFTFDIWITDPVAEEWYGGESSHDLPECVWLFSHILAGMKVADCGAHHGFLTIPLSKAVGPTGVVEQVPAPKNRSGKHGRAVKRQHGFFAGNARIAVLPAATGAEIGGLS